MRRNLPFRIVWPLRSLTLLNAGLCGAMLAITLMSVPAASAQAAKFTGVQGEEPRGGGPLAIGASSSQTSIVFNAAAVAVSS